MKTFSSRFQADFIDLLKWRRDVRHFKPTPVDPEQLRTCLKSFEYAPSVGLSEPWRIVRVRSDAARAKALENFRAANLDALKGYKGEKAALYATLKLSGMEDAPEHLAIFCDDSTEKGAGLGAQSMPEMRRYSVVSATTLFWLQARALGIGVGWVSILEPEALREALGLPDTWKLVSYLCVGHPLNPSDTPELEQKGWEERDTSLSTPLEV